MTDLTVTESRLVEGIWAGVLAGAPTDGPTPEIEVTHLQTRLPDVEVIARPEAGDWVLRVPVPPETLSDGVQTYLIHDVKSGTVLDSFTELAGDVLAHDIRSELALLREELDLLKRAFRQHCRETT